MRTLSCSESDRNSDFKTTVGVYSLRAKTAQPFVSLPVAWAELERALKRGDANSLVFGIRSELRFQDYRRCVFVAGENCAAVRVVARRVGRTRTRAEAWRCELSRVRNQIGTPISRLPSVCIRCGRKLRSRSCRCPSRGQNSNAR